MKTPLSTESLLTNVQGVKGKSRVELAKGENCGDRLTISNVS
jgi:hypothetical protein